MSPKDKGPRGPFSKFTPKDILYLTTLVTVLGCTLGHKNFNSLIEGILKWIGSKF